MNTTPILLFVGIAVIIAVFAYSISWTRKQSLVGTWVLVFPDGTSVTMQFEGEPKGGLYKQIIKREGSETREFGHWVLENLASLRLVMMATDIKEQPRFGVDTQYWVSFSNKSQIRIDGPDRPKWTLRKAANFVKIAFDAYQRYPRDKFESLNPDWWFQELSTHISSQVFSRPFVLDPERIAKMPEAVQAIYYCWEIAGEVGGNGFSKYLLDQQGHHAPFAHAGLKLVGASELVERMEAGIPHAISAGCAEFSSGTNMDWFRKFPGNPKYPTLESVDVDIYDLANDGIRDKCNAFIGKHREVFVA